MHRQACAKWYRKNKERHHGIQRRLRHEKRKWVQELKAARGCEGEDCFITNPQQLDFHHRDPHTKIANISDAVNSNWGKARILEEISKCDLLCANCHRII